MKKNRLGRRWTALLIVMVVLFIAVVGVVMYKEREYKASADYYDSLRLGDDG